MPRTCPVCQAWESRTIDRLLVLGYGPMFVSTRWGLKRRDIRLHRDTCLVGDKRANVVADLQSLAGGGVIPNG